MVRAAIEILSRRGAGQETQISQGEARSDAMRALAPSRRWSALAVALFAVLAIVVYAGRAIPARLPPVEGDGQGYYAYLPAVLLEHDPSFRTLVARHPANAGGRILSVLQAQPSGAYLDKYSFGVAALASGFFAVGHVVAEISGQTADGYSRDEESFTGLAAVVAGLVGLLALRAVLRRRFRDEVVAVTLLASALGSGLMHWMVYDPLYSHAYSFAAVAVFLLSAIRLRERPASWWRAVGCGLAAGVVVLLRIPSVVIVLPFLLLGVGDRGGLRRRIAGIRHHFARLTVAAACMLLPLVPQELIWERAMGRWLSSPYVGEAFNWLHPQLQALYSFRPHGLLPYAPVLALAFLGLPFLWRQHRDWWWSAVLVIVVDTYLLCAWHNWFLGVGFGQRGFVDMVPILALPFAAMLSAAWQTRWRRPLLAVVGLLTATTMLGMLAYWSGRLPHVGATFENDVSVMFGGRLPGGLNAN